MSIFCFFLGGRGLGRQPSPSRHFLSKTCKISFPKKIFFQIWLLMLLNWRLCILCESAFSGPDTKQDEMGTRKMRKKVKKKFQKKNRKIFLRFFFGVCPCYYLAIPKKKKWKKWKPGSGGAPVLGHSSPKGYAFIARRCRWHSPWQGPTYPGRGL